jgi:hypothetical protein
LPDDAIVDPVLLVIDLAVDAKREAETQGIPGQEIDEEIGPIFEAIMQGLRQELASQERGMTLRAVKGLAEPNLLPQLYLA